MDDDRRQVQLLSIFHYVVGALIGVFGCLPSIHLTMGIVIMTGALKDDHGQAPPPFLGLIIVIFASLMMLVAWTMAVLIVIAGRRLSGLRSYTFCVVIAAIECLFFPFGTVLGVFSLVVLTRPTAKQLFEAPAAPAP